MDSNRRLTVVIGGRDALPLRAIPYATNWNSFYPEMLAWYLGQNDKRFNDEIAPLMPLKAHQMNDMAPHALAPNEWGAVASRLRDAGNISDYSAVSCLPVGAFVWLDDFDRVWRAWVQRESIAPFEQLPKFEQQWKKRFKDDYPDEDKAGGIKVTGQILRESESVGRSGGDTLNLAPSLLDAETRAMIFEGFPATAPPESQIEQTQTPAQRRDKLDITGERGTRRRILEHWDDIQKQYGNTADGRQVKRVLDRELGVKPPALKTVQNHLGQLRKEKLIP